MKRRRDTYVPFGLWKYDRNQMRKMTHLEYFKLADTYILFDYQNRNPLNQEARVCKVEIDKVRIK